jgi:hypothetical protein
MITSMASKTPSEVENFISTLRHMEELHGEQETEGDLVYHFIQGTSRNIAYSDLILDKHWKATLAYQMITLHGFITSLDETTSDKIASVNLFINTQPANFIRVLRLMYPARKELTEQNLIETVKKQLLRVVISVDINAVAEHFKRIWKSIWSVRGDDGDFSPSEWSSLYDYMLDYMFVRQIDPATKEAYYKDQKVSNEAIEKIKNAALSSTNKQIINNLSQFERAVMQATKAYIDVVQASAQYGLVPRKHALPERRHEDIKTEMQAEPKTKKQKESHPSVTTAKQSQSSKASAGPKCPHCNNDPAIQKAKGQAVCVLFDKQSNTKARCTLFSHPDCNRRGPWAGSEVQKALARITITPKTGSAFHPRWLDAEKRLRRDANKQIIDPPSLEKNAVMNTILLENEITTNTNFTNSNNRKMNSDSPWIYVQVGSELILTALLDTCSSGPKALLCNYISNKVVELIKINETRTKIPLISSCSCSRAVTRTPTGTFETATCIHLNVTLYREGNKLENKRITFRVVSGLVDEMIIGIHTIRDLDLTKVFRTLFTNNSSTTITQEDETNKPPAVCQEIVVPPTIHESEAPDTSAVSHNTRSAARRANLLNSSSCANNLQTTILSTEAELLTDFSPRVAESSEPCTGTNFLND